MEELKFFVHPSSIVDSGAMIQEGTKIWHFSHIMGSARIGAQCTLGQNVFVGNQVVIGDHVKIQNNVSIYEGVTIEDDVFLGPSAVFTNVYNPRSRVERKDEFRPTLVKKGASIGANATIICGVTIGSFSFIGAGAVVKSDVPAYAIIAGVPGKQIGWMSEHGSRLIFDKDNVAICGDTGDKYKLHDGTVTKLESQ